MIHVVLPFFPPTVNKLYFTRGRLRRLSTEGKCFLNEVKNYLLRQHPDFLAYFKPNKEYELLFLLHYTAGSLYSISWLKDPKVSRHKKNDAANRIKILEDAIVAAAGHDDMQHWSVSVTKVEALVGQEPYVEVWVWGEEESGPISRFIATRTV